MALTLADVEKIANLARLELNEAQKRRYQEQLSAVLAYAERLNELDLAAAPPTAHAVARENIMREDVVEPCLSREEALGNAPQQAQNQFVIQAVLDE